MKRALFALCLVSAPLIALGGGGPRVTAFDVTMPEGARLEFRGALRISPPDGDFGGLSGLLWEDGEALAISDRTRWFRFPVAIEDGRLEGIGAIASGPLRDAGGADADGRGWDSEGLAHLADGRLLISFEGDHRVQEFDDEASPAGAELRAAEWEEFGSNSGLEALAVDASDRIWAIRERSGAEDRPFPVFVSSSSGWEEKTLPRDNGYLPTGADFGPDGWLWIVERKFSLFTGFKTRIRRARWGAGAAPDAIEIMATFPASAGLDNLEGIAVREEDGETRILLVSDDNFMALQRNVLALFAYSEP